MKKQVGVDIAGSTVFAPGAAGAGTITLVGRTYALNQLLLITNVTRNTIIYNFADSSNGAASFTNNVLTLDADTSTHSANDVLQVLVDVVDDMAVSDGESRNTLSRILLMLMAPLGFDKSLQRQRVTGIIESGTITTVSTVTTVTTCSTVTTCGTVTNLSTIDTLQGRIQVYGANLSAWADCVRSRIT